MWRIVRVWRTYGERSEPLNEGDQYKIVGTKHTLAKPAQGVVPMEPTTKTRLLRYSKRDTVEEIQIETPSGCA
jgi:hypothetical protein